MNNPYQLPFDEIKALLEVKTLQYNTVDFIQNDPILLPHQFQNKNDIEIIGFIVALIAWGKRKMIIQNGEKLIALMGGTPFQFVMDYEKGMLPEKAFVHRTFNTADLDYILRALKHCYSNYSSLEEWFFLNSGEKGIQYRIQNFRDMFMTIEHEKRSEKHIANPMKGSAAKRINMFLRWMVRKDTNGVDFGLWDKIPMEELYVPLDVHTGNTARQLGLITRKQNDWKALEELMNNLQKMDPKDPCKYDYALFNLDL